MKEFLFILILACGFYWKDIRNFYVHSQNRKFCNNNKVEFNEKYKAWAYSVQGVSLPMAPPVHLECQRYYEEDR